MSKVREDKAINEQEDAELKKVKAGRIEKDKKEKKVKEKKDKKDKKEKKDKKDKKDKKEMDVEKKENINEVDEGVDLNNASSDIDNTSSESDNANNSMSSADKSAEAPQKDEAQAEEGQSSTIFVGQLSWNIDEEWLAREFEQFGDIVSARVVKSPEGRSRGFGYVDFTTPEAAQRAIEEMKGKEIDGRAINVDLQENKGGERRRRPDNASNFTGDKSKLMLNNLSFQTTDEDIMDIVSKYGEVINAYHKKDMNTDRYRGYGFVTFVDASSAEKFMGEWNQQELNGRRIRIEFAEQNRPQGGGFGGGRGGGRGGRGGFGFGGGRGGNDRRGGRGGGFSRGRGGNGGGRGNFNSFGGGRPSYGAQPQGTREVFN